MLPEPLLAFEPVSPALAEALGRVDAAHAAYQAARGAGRILPNVVEALRVELTYHSNAIEGSTLSLRETQLVIEGRSPLGGKPIRELYEARNHDRALRLVEEWAASRAASAPITERDLLDVHAVVLTDIDARSAGALRSEHVRIAGTRFIPPGSQMFPELLPAMLERVNRPGVHPVVQAAEFHYNMVAMHPFADGNGRTARLMMNDHLLRRGYPLVIIDVNERAEYLSALDDANAGVWERFAKLVARSAERSIRRAVGGFLSRSRTHRRAWERTTNALRWASTAASVLLVIAFAASCRWTVFRRAQFGDAIVLKAGMASYTWTTAEYREEVWQTQGRPLIPGWNWRGGSREIAMEWWPPFGYSSGTVRGRGQVFIAIWPPWLFSSGVACALWYRRLRRFRIGCCPKCGYDLSATPADGVCPECGTEVSSSRDLVSEGVAGV